MINLKLCLHCSLFDVFYATELIAGNNDAASYIRGISDGLRQLKIVHVLESIQFQPQIESIFRDWHEIVDFFVTSHDMQETVMEALGEAGLDLPRVSNSA